MPGLKARPLELPAFQPVSQLHGPRFQKCIRMRRPCVYNLPDETGPALCPKMDGIIRVCATACSSPPPGAPPVGISIQIPTNLDQFRKRRPFSPRTKVASFYRSRIIESPLLVFLSSSSVLSFRSHDLIEGPSSKIKKKTWGNISLAISLFPRYFLSGGQ